MKRRSLGTRLQGRAWGHTLSCNLSCIVAPSSQVESGNEVTGQGLGLYNLSCSVVPSSQVESGNEATGQGLGLYNHVLLFPGFKAGLGTW